MAKRWIDTPKGPVEAEGAEIVPGVPDLFIHHAYITDVTGPYFTEELWVITHRWSGLRIPFMYSRKRDALRVAKHLPEEIDWSIKDPKDLVAAHPLLKEIIASVNEEHTKGQVVDK